MLVTDVKRLGKDMRNQLTTFNYHKYALLTSFHTKNRYNESEIHEYNIRIIIMYEYGKWQAILIEKVVHRKY